MAHKVIVTLSNGVAAAKADAIKQQVAAHLGLVVEDVLLVPGVSSLVVVAVADKPAPVAHTAPTYAGRGHKSEKE